MPGRLSRLNSLNTSRTLDQPRPRLKPRGLPPALEPHGVYAATNPADAALYGNDILGSHRVHINGDSDERFHSTFHGVLIRDVTLGYLDYSTPVRIEVRSLPENITVIVPATGTSTISTTLADGTTKTINASPVMAAIPAPGKAMTLECGADAAHLIIRIDRQAFDTHLSRLLGRTLDSAIELEPAFDISTVTASRWNFAVQMLHAEIFEPQSLLHETIGLGSLEEFLMSALLHCQQSNYSSRLTSSKPPMSSTVRDAMEFIEEHLSEPIAVHDVAKAAGVSTRTLQNLFAKDVEQSPTSWIKNRRLERVRSDLADATANSDMTVTDVATRWGFTHLGRFAVTYKNRFGESPSQTLRT